MKKFFKKYFIPHEENDYKPHFLRFETTLLVLSGLLCIEVIFLVSVFVIYPRINFLASIVSSVLVDETNTNRITNDLTVLNVNPLLSKAAELKAEDMAKRGYFAHTSPDGLSPWYWLQKVGYDYDSAGENLAVNFFDSSDVTNAWMDSPSHRANILNGKYSEIGVAAATGTYEGHQTIFVVQFFGHPVSYEIAALPANIVTKTKSIVPKPAASSQTIAVATSSVVASAVKGESISQVETSTFTPATNRVDNQIERRTSSFAKLLMSPRLIMTYFYVMLFTVVLLALALKIFVNINIQHPALIVNGVLMLLVIASALLINQYLSFSQIHILVTSI